MKKIFSLICVLLLFSNCANSFSPPKIMNEIMDSWLGEDLDTVIKHWGYPDKEQIIANKRLYYWNHAGSTYSKINGQYTMSSLVYCRRILETDDSYKVINTFWEGDNCPATYYTAYKVWINPEKSYHKYKAEQKKLKQEQKLQQKLQKQKSQNM